MSVEWIWTSLFTKILVSKKRPLSEVNRINYFATAGSISRHQHFKENVYTNGGVSSTIVWVGGSFQRVIHDPSCHTKMKKKNGSRQNERDHCRISLARLVIWEQPDAIMIQRTVAATPKYPSDDSVHFDIITSPLYGNVHTLHKSLFRNKNWSPWKSVIMMKSAQI
jgi:hypothetical protein